MASGKFALTYTVKNESRLLPSGIEYHLAAGCSRIYIFWDNTTDNAPELIAKYPQVVARNSFTPDELSDAPPWLKKILPAWKPDLDVRKIANTYYAALDAAREGIGWLGSIDADELIVMSPNEARVEGHIPRQLEKVPENIDQILMRNLESVPTSAESENPFVDCIYFLNRFPLTESAWRYSRAALIRATRSPKLIAWYDWLFYEFRFVGALKRMMREPGTGRRVPGTYFLGYSSYKSFIKTKVAPDFSFATHSWRRSIRAPRNLYVGNVLHFDMLDASYFEAKFRQRTPARDIFYLRYMLSNIARNCSSDEIRDFFEAYIAIKDPNRIARLKRKGIIAEIHSASSLLKKLGEKSSTLASQEPV